MCPVNIVWVKSDLAVWWVLLLLVSCFFLLYPHLFIFMICSASFRFITVFYSVHHYWFRISSYITFFFVFFYSVALCFLCISFIIIMFSYFLIISCVISYYFRYFFLILFKMLLNIFLIQKLFRPILSSTVSELYSNLHRQTPNFCADLCSRWVWKEMYDINIVLF
jgi:hypothetical protein